MWRILDLSGGDTVAGKVTMSNSPEATETETIIARLLQPGMMVREFKNAPFVEVAAVDQSTASKTTIRFPNGASQSTGKNAKFEVVSSSVPARSAS